jgi:hypothetical protein
MSYWLALSHLVQTRWNAPRLGDFWQTGQLYSELISKLLSFDRLEYAGVHLIRKNILIETQRLKYIYLEDKRQGVVVLQYGVIPDSQPR